jgi:predicted small secreted protein
MSNNEKNLTSFEQELLKNLNTRAAKILKIEEISKSYKMPIDMNFIYEMDEESLDNTVELFMNMKSSADYRNKK